LHKAGVGSTGVSIGWVRPDAPVLQTIAGDNLAPVVPEIRMYSVVNTAVEGEAQQAQFQVVRTGGSLALPVTVNYTVTGTATSGTDYTALTGSITIPAGQTSATITIAGLADTLVEGTETVTVELREGFGYNVGPISNRTATASILDN